MNIIGFYNCPGIYTNAAAFLKVISERGISTSLNPQYDATGAWDNIEELSPYLNFLILNEAEVRGIGRSDDISVAVEKLLRWGISNVVVTMGKNGASCYSYLNGVVNECHHSAPDLAAEVVRDTTGCGDAFAGAFLVEWISSKDECKAIRAGCVSGAAAATVVGGSTRPEDSTYHSLFQQHNS